MNDLTRPKVRKVTVEVEGYDGQLARFTYLDTLPDQEPDDSTGIELELATNATRTPDDFGPTRIAVAPRYVHTLRIENSPTWRGETVDPPAPAGPGELEAAPAAIEAP